MSEWMKYAKRIGATLAFAALVYGVLYAITENAGQNRADEASIAERAELRDHLEANEGAVALLTEQLEGLGQTPVVDPPTTNTGPTNFVSPSLDSVQLLVRLGIESACGGPSCLGPVGPPGAPGVGTPGPAGTNGSSPSTDLLISLIQPLIPAPIPGANGVDGAPGRGVASVSCSSAMSFDLTFSFTDGTTQTLSCGPVDPVTPEPPVDPVEPTQ